MLPCTASPPPAIRRSASTRGRPGSTLKASSSDAEAGDARAHAVEKSLARHGQRRRVLARRLGVDLDPELLRRLAPQWSPDGQPEALRLKLAVRPLQTRHDQVLRGRPEPVGPRHVGEPTEDRLDVVRRSTSAARARRRAAPRRRGARDPGTARCAASSAAARAGRWRRGRRRRQAPRRCSRPRPAPARGAGGGRRPSARRDGQARPSRRRASDRSATARAPPAHGDPARRHSPNTSAITSPLTARDSSR